MHRTAAVITVGSELVSGSRVDTHTAEIARELLRRAITVEEATSVGDSARVLSGVVSRCVGTFDLVIVTGGLGPTHDDITREAVAQALGATLQRDDRIVELLQPIRTRHSNPEAFTQVLRQADVIPGAEVFDATTGTAPGQVIGVGSTTLALLPGPPAEMRPMLARLLDRYPLVRESVRELGVADSAETDIQLTVSGVLNGFPGIGFTILAKPGDVRVLLTDEGAGSTVLDDAVHVIARQLGDRCYTIEGDSLAATVVGAARETGVRIAVAESCTGGMVAAEITSVPGASEVFMGAAVTYANQAKTDVLDVPPGLLAQYGAVSEECARAMAEGVLDRFGADVSVAVTGVAGPGGGTVEKPVGTVWFATAVRDSDGPVTSSAILRSFPPMSRDAIRDRATVVALDSLRRIVRARFTGE